MQTTVPNHVLKLAPGRMVIVPNEKEVVCYLRDDEFGMRRYPRHCTVELRLRIFEIEHVLATVMMVRVAKLDAVTFESWIDVSDPRGVRAVQCLAAQETLDVNIVAPTETRLLRTRNTLRAEASKLVEMVRQHNAWQTADFDRACRRVSQLYPTPTRLWWSTSQNAGATHAAPAGNPAAGGQIAANNKPPQRRGNT